MSALSLTPPWTQIIPFLLKAALAGGTPRRARYAER